MTGVHSFFIPSLTDIADLRGLVEYLGQKVSVDNVCLYCNGVGKMFMDLGDVRRHMSDKGHIKIGDTLEEELTDFYDFGDEEEYEDEDDDLNMVIETQQLVLPSGNLAGHRNYAKIYRQHLRPTRAVTRTQGSAVSRLMAQYRGIGSYTDLRVETKQKMQQEKHRQKIDYRTKLLVGMRANNQTHFRPQVDF